MMAKSLIFVLVLISFVAVLSVLCKYTLFIDSS